MSSVSQRPASRYLALWLPFLPADRLSRRGTRASASSPARDEPPRVFVEKVKGALRLAALDRRAARLGLVPGLALADARARIPSLDVMDMDPAADAAFLERLADFCDRYTPLVSIDGRDGLLLDITGCAHLFQGEAQLRADLRKRLAQNGIGIHASIAGTPDAARVLARFGEDALVAPGEEAAAVRHVSVAMLDAEPASILALSRAGLKTIGDLADRPRAPLAARFGQDLVNGLERILGERDVHIASRRPVPERMADKIFAEPIGLQEDMLAALAGLAECVGQMLEKSGEGGRRFEASFFRADGKVFRIAAETSHPQRHAPAIMRLFRERLDSLPDPLDPGFGFDLIRLGVTSSDPFAATQSSLDGNSAEKAEIAELVDRLSARFGTEAVQRFVAADTHIPERAVRVLPALAAPDFEAAWEAPSVPRPIHMFHPPQPIETLAEVPDGPPLRFRWRRVQHEIARAEGPERIAAEWWRANEPTRDYYRIEDSAGRRFWVFREGLYGVEAETPRWYLHGIFA